MGVKYAENPFGLRIVNLASGKTPLKGAPVGGNSGYVNPRNTFNKEHLIAHTTDYKQSTGHLKAQQEG